MDTVTKFYPYKGDFFALTVDAADAHVLDAFKWSVTNRSRHASAPKYYLRRRVWKNGKQVEVIYLHREVLGVLPGIVVDHLDGNGLNCTRANMILTTQPENAKYHRQIHRKRK